MLLLIVIPRSRSISIESSIWSWNSRCVTPPQAWINRSANVDFPWSMWAMMQKFRIKSIRWVLGERRRYLIALAS